MADSNSDVVLRLRLDGANALQAETQRAQAAVQRFGQQAGSAGGPVGILRMQMSSTGETAASLTARFKGLLAPLAGLVSGLAGLNKLIEVQRQFDILNAGLVTATKSSEGAAIAFQALQQFAAKTPFDLAQAVQGFTQLVNLGLTPSERALTSYGNTASALGKDLSQMIEAVADAATGEFERLKEFGIKSKTEGDKVIFTFQGVKTSVQNNAAAIEEYLIKLGENQFAGAMEARVKTLDGAISNLGDTWDALFRTVSQSGIGDAIKDAVNLASDALGELNTELASGRPQGYLRAIAAEFRGFGEDAKQALQDATRFIADQFVVQQRTGRETVDFLIDAFRDLPQNVRAFIKIVVTEVAAGFDEAKALAKLFKDSTKAIFTDDTVAAANARYQAATKAAQEAREGSIRSIIEERDTAVRASKTEAEAAAKARAEYDKRNAARAGATGDRLARFKVGGDTASTSSSSDAAKKAADAAARADRELTQIGLQGLQTQEAAEELSYQRREKSAEDFYAAKARLAGIATTVQVAQFQEEALAAKTSGDRQVALARAAQAERAGALQQAQIAFQREEALRQQTAARATESANLAKAQIELETSANDLAYETRTEDAAAYYDRKTELARQAAQVEIDSARAALEAQRATLDPQVLATREAEIRVLEQKLALQQRAATAGRGGFLAETDAQQAARLIGSIRAQADALSQAATLGLGSVAEVQNRIRQGLAATGPEIDAIIARLETLAAAEKNPEKLAEIQGTISSIRGQVADLAASARTPVAILLDQWQDTASQIQQVQADLLAGLASGFADMVVDGKASFEDLAKGAIKALVRIAFQALITRAITAAIGGYSVNVPAQQSYGQLAAAETLNAAPIVSAASSLKSAPVIDTRPLAGASNSAVYQPGAASASKVAAGNTYVTVMNAPAGTNASVNERRDANGDRHLEIDLLADQLEKRIAANTAKGGPILQAVKARMAAPTR